eukprot:2050599-Prorocentrum_lima.AAC.1
MGMARTMVDKTPQTTQKKNISTSAEFHGTFGVELEDFKAMICHRHPDGAAQGEIYFFKNYNHKKGKPKDMGYWWTGSTWFK